MFSFRFALQTLFVCVVYVIASSEANSADISPIGSRGGEVSIKIQGDIVIGDVQKLKSIIGMASSKGVKIANIHLLSNGGSVAAGVDMALMIRNGQFGVYVPDNAVCASSCFTLFAAGVNRRHGSNVRIGVHSAVNPLLGETSAAKSITVDLVRFLSALGTPDAILGKLVKIRPDDISWLNAQELALMSSIAKVDVVPTQFIEELTKVRAPIVLGNRTITAAEKRESRKLNALGLAAPTPQEQLSYFYKAAQLNPYDPEILTNYGFYLHILGDAAGAVDVLSLSVKLKSNRGSTWVNLGEAVADLGQQDWATECFVRYYFYSSKKDIALSWINNMAMSEAKPVRASAARAALDILYRRQ